MNPPLAGLARAAAGAGGVLADDRQLGARFGADADMLNRAIWHSVKGFDTPYNYGRPISAEAFVVRIAACNWPAVSDGAAPIAPVVPTSRTTRRRCGLAALDDGPRLDVRQVDSDSTVGARADEIRRAVSVFTQLPLDLGLRVLAYRTLVQHGSRRRQFRIGHVILPKRGPRPAGYRSASRILSERVGSYCVRRWIRRRAEEAPGEKQCPPRRGGQRRRPGNGAQTEAHPATSAVFVCCGYTSAIVRRKRGGRCS